jgi:hypothetical protein
MGQPELSRNAVIVADGPNGGSLDLISPQGEIVYSFYVSPGRHRASIWLDLVEPGYSLQVADGCVAFRPRMGVSTTAHPEYLKSDANPDFVPTSATRLEREMRIEMNEMRNLRLAMQKEARLRAVDAVEVLETIPTPNPQVKREEEAQA